MDISSLSVPQAGRSRFSKALPTPPSGIDDQLQIPSRELPDAPPAPPPPSQKNSILTTKPSTRSLQSKNLDSPLPVLPIMTEAPRPRVKAGPIARKPVAQLTPPAFVGNDKKSKEMKRKSSISSLLSAYSRSSSDWAQRSSHESDFTKASEPSYSPEREALDSLPPVPPKKSMETTADTISDGISEVTSYTIIDAFPPPPPLKDPSRPRTPSTVHHVDEVPGRAQDQEGNPKSLSPVSLGRGGSPRAGREIWRRRASSKSDASLVIADLKLPGSNGSTASTSHTPANKAELPSSLPQLPPKINEQPILPLPSKQQQQQQQQQHQQQQQQQQQQPIVTLPPRTTSLSSSLPGRNIRPVKKSESIDEHDEMKKFLKLSNLKGLIRRGGDDDDDGNEELKLLKKSEQPNVSGVMGNIEAHRPEPPVKDNFIQQQQNAAAMAPTAMARKASLSQASPSDTPAPPPKESGKGTGTTISRRPVGAALTQAVSQVGGQPEPEKNNTASLNQSVGGQQPRNPVGTLPHPRQRQQQTQRASPPYPSPPNDPASPPGQVGRSISAVTQPQLNPSTGPAAVMAGFHQPPNSIRIGNPNYQDQASNPTSSSAREYPETVSLSSTQQSTNLSGTPTAPTAPTAPTQGPPTLSQPSTLDNESQDLMQATGWGAEALEDRVGAEPATSAAAAAAVARFPRTQNWGVQCTVEGVWPPSQLTNGHYNCFARHSKFVNSRNTHYALACQACGVADTTRRCQCSHCNLRLCLPCVELLVANGRDLQATMGALVQQGRIRDWSQYPKQNADQSA